MKRILFAAMMLLMSAGLMAQIPAFPTAEGFGRWATGGRGGEVVEVTNLNDSGEGSLRWALEQHKGKPITVVFRVSGVIFLESQLRCSRTDGVTIAGQTAPGDGICIRGAKVNFGGCSNVVIRHLRIRLGGVGTDGEFEDGGSIGIENASNWIIDHCTFGWSAEENMTIYDNDLTTVQWCIVHEGLYDAGHGKGSRGYGSQWGGQRCTYHHNLLAHNKSRSPRLNGARSNDTHVMMEYANNVNYNWGNYNACYGGDMVEGKTHRVNFINNYYKPGPAYPASKTSYFVNASFNGNQKTTQIPVYWLSGNVMEGNSGFTKNNFNGLRTSDYTDRGIARNKLIASAPFEISDPVNVESAQNAYNSVLAGAGAFPRDAVDARIIEEVKTGTATCSGSVSGVAPGIIDKYSDAGGYPEYKIYNEVSDADHDGMDDAWETLHGFDPANAADRNLVLKSGYTALEAYLCGLVGEDIPVEFAKPYDITVAQDGSGDYTTIQEALDAAPDKVRTTIFVKNGTYAEKLFIGNRWAGSNKIISLIGEDVDKVIITWDDYSGKEISYPGKEDPIKADGSTCGTFTINAPDFYMENITVKNPSTSAQAIALCQKGDRHVLKNCKILGNQDTHRTKKGRRYFYYNCTIEGGVDFIYAGGTCYFYQCNIVSNRNGFVTAPEDVPAVEKLSTGKPLYYGFFFNDCDLTATAGVADGSCYLGRPWGPQSGSVFMNCRLGKHINAAGWSKMGDETWKDCSFMEYKSQNADGSALADVSKRVNWSAQVTEDDRYYLMSLKYIYNKVNPNNVFDPLPVAVAPQAPQQLTVSGKNLSWTAVPEATAYAIYADGRLLDYAESNTYYDMKSTATVSKYQVKSIGSHGNMSAFNGSEAEPTVAELDSILSPDYRVKLSVVKSDDAAGSVSISPEQPSYDKDALVTLTAEYNYGYRFMQWEDENGNVLSTDAVYQHKMDREIVIKAVFRKLDIYTLDIQTETNGAYQSHLPQGIVYADAAPQEVGESFGYEDGHELKLYVKDHPVFRFSGWEDGSQDIPRSLKMDGNKSLSARFVQEPFLAAWTFGQIQFDYYQPDMNPDDITAEINLLDSEGNYITFDKAEGYFGKNAAMDKSGGKAYFELDAYVGAQEKVFVWSKIKVQEKGYSRYLLEYSIDYGENYVGFSSCELPAVDTWVSLSGNVPAEALKEEAFKIRWIPDYTSKIFGNTAGASQTLLSDVVLLTGAFTALEHPIVASAEVQVFDLLGRQVMRSENMEGLDWQMLPEGIYLLRRQNAQNETEIIKIKR